MPLPTHRVSQVFYRKKRVSPKATRVARAWYKSIGGESTGKKTPFDSAIERASRLLNDDLDGVNPFELSSAKSKSLISFLVTDCNKWLQAHKNNQIQLKEDRKAG